jgi:iron-sulfur cluster assembly protein
MSINITDEAAQKARELRTKLGKPGDWVLHVKLDPGGCSGFTYKLDFIESPDDLSDYKVFDFDDLQLLCDKKSYLFLIDTVIDYEETLMSSGFTFKIPSATGMCGCGESVAF